MNSIKDYIRRRSGVSNLDLAMRAELSELEKKLLETQDLMEARGKCGRGVPIIIPQDIKPVLKYLANSIVRDEAGLKIHNKYLFANTSAGVLRAYDILKILCKRVDLRESNLSDTEKVHCHNLSDDEHDDYAFGHDAEEEGIRRQEILKLGKAVRVFCLF